MVVNRFFQNKGPFPLMKILKEINYDASSSLNTVVYNIHDLENAGKNDITFLNNGKYTEISTKTKALACITSQNLSKHLPSKCLKIIVKDVLFAVAQVSKLFYPKADMDYPDINLKNSTDFKNKYTDVTFGKNVLIGDNVKIGKYTNLGSNSIIESNVIIGSSCSIGSFVVIRNSIIEDKVYIQDGSKIGIKGFGFLPSKKKNLRAPHIGKVILKEGVEIGSNCTIDRGSLNDTIIENNTFLDNQIHIAHNVKIGKNCIIAGQVGIAGSATLGDNVMIGGQAGISGHLKIGNNVKIGGGSGVLSNIPDNSQVMGYPAVSIKDFVKERKK